MHPRSPASGPAPVPEADQKTATPPARTSGHTGPAGPAGAVATVALRPVGETDLPMLARFLVDPAAAGPFQWYGYADPARFRRHWVENGLLGEDGGQLIVMGDGQPAGFVAWRRVVVSPSSHCWNMGAQLMPEACGRGIGTRAQQQLVRYLFSNTPVMRIEADTEAGNVAEQRALEKAGFTREGVRRAIVFRDGKWRDGISYSVLRDDPLPAGV
ncbi:GNAT family N-acetyltransferase [Streptomyces sp. NBC_00820]|uniref:GNAT family N-acetyltransferase n=1 Tax=Streptomyces sp. NBC_00820 TaxID=2975842 RepID=UPI002ED19519|nr:GNAT family N-acetyltransferase [Streptomyces sp. NBC_00820]